MHSNGISGKESAIDDGKFISDLSGTRWRTIYAIKSDGNEQKKKNKREAEI